MIIPLYHSIGFDPENDEFVSFGVFDDRREADNRARLMALEIRNKTGRNIKYGSLGASVVVTPVTQLVSADAGDAKDL